MKIAIQFTAALLAGFCLSTPNAKAVQIASDFVITNRATGQPIHRDDFKGKILFLDFFAYWCGPCQDSSPKVETEIAKYYQDKGGNPFGVKVEVIAVSIESQNPASTDAFIAKAGLQTVAFDYGNVGGAWAQFGTGSIPHFVVMNGLTGGTNTQWEVLHSAAGFYGSAYYRSIIDGIRPAPAEIVVEQPKGTGLVDGVSKKGFGTVSVGVSGSPKTFTIKNTGGANLTGLAVYKASPINTNAADFLVTPLPSKTLAPGASMTFKVTFKPLATGPRSTFVRIKSNDADENPFDIKVTGAGS